MVGAVVAATRDVASSELSPATQHAGSGGRAYAAK